LDRLLNCGCFDFFSETQICVEELSLKSTAPIPVDRLSRSLDTFSQSLRVLDISNAEGLNNDLLDSIISCDIRFLSEFKADQYPTSVERHSGFSVKHF
jgi:hypothetical protein